MERRPDYKTKVEQELDKLSTQAEDLLSRLSGIVPGSEADAATQELVLSCKSALNRLQKMVTDADEDPGRLSEFLYHYHPTKLMRRLTRQVVGAE
jgi:hypothetical protein